MDYQIIPNGKRNWALAVIRQIAILIYPSTSVPSIPLQATSVISSGSKTSIYLVDPYYYNTIIEKSVFVYHTSYRISSHLHLIKFTRATKRISSELINEIYRWFFDLKDQPIIIHLFSNLIPKDYSEFSISFSTMQNANEWSIIYSGCTLSFPKSRSGSGDARSDSEFRHGHFPESSRHGLLASKR